jgi:tetratricopeptide (TPR) repeat protein
MDIYTSFFDPETISNEDALRIASYYEKHNDYGKAGRFYSYCMQYSRALKLFMQCGEKEIPSAIEVVGKANTESLTHQLVDYLNGEKDGIQKDLNHIYRLYLALKRYDDAAKNALLIVKNEQDLGNYLGAHSIVVETIRYLEDANCKVSLQLREAFINLHTYERIKYYVALKDHSHAARLLLRLSTHFSKFPSHRVKLLTLTVVECTRANLRSLAYENAAMLITPQYRSQLDPAFKRNIEGIVRKRGSIFDEAMNEPPEETSPCPISGVMLPVTTLICPTTGDQLPMCIISGKHMVLDDWCFCPNSKFPALYSEYVRYIRESTKRNGSSSITGDVSENSSSQLQQQSRRGNSHDNRGPETDDVISPSSVSPTSKLVSATDMFLSAPDPIFGKSVSVNDLILCTKEDAMKYIQRYNNVIEKKSKSDNNQEEGKEGGDGAEEGEGTGKGGGPLSNSSRKGDFSPKKGGGVDDERTQGGDEDEMATGYSPIRTAGSRSFSKETGSTKQGGASKDQSNKSTNKSKLDRIQQKRRRNNAKDRR